MLLIFSVYLFTFIVIVRFDSRVSVKSDYFRFQQGNNQNSTYQKLSAL